MDKNIPKDKDLKAIISSLTGDHEPETREELLVWLKQNPNNIHLYNQYKQIMNVSKGGEKRFDKTTSFEKVDLILSKQQISKKLRLLQYFSKVAAVFIIALLSILAYNNFLTPKTNLGLSIETSFGNRTKTALPDGSVINLNAASNVNFLVDQKNRKIQLNGEAFFKVAKSKKPFIVKTETQIIKVYGTEFNVEAYHDDDFIKTTLTEGKISIEIDNDKNQKPQILLPGYQAIYSKKNRTLKINKCEIYKSIAWLDNKMLLRGTTFYELGKKLERRYKTKITFSDEKLKNYHFTGSFKDETVDEVIQTLCTISKSKYKKTGTNYFIY